MTTNLLNGTLGASPGQPSTLSPPATPMLLACHSAPPPGSSGRGDDGGKRGGPSALFPPIVAPRAQDPRRREPARVTSTYDRPVRRPGGADALPGLHRAVSRFVTVACGEYPRRVPTPGGAA